MSTATTTREAQTTTIDIDVTAHHLRTLISACGAAQGALAPILNGHSITKAEQRTQAEFARDDLHYLRGAIRAMALSMGVEY
jgi:hypothetical protein